MMQRSGRVQQAFGWPDESHEQEAANQQATAAEALQALIEQGPSGPDLPITAEGMRNESMASHDPTAGMDAAIAGYSGISGLPYDMAPDNPADAHPWHDASPMTQELSERAWQQAIATASAAIEAQDPSITQAAYEQAVGNAVPTDNAPPQVDVETCLRMISDAAEQQAIALYGDTATPHQREQTLDDLVRRLLPGQQDPTGFDVPMPSPHAMQQQPDDPTQFMDPFGPMGPMM
jgi:hypothetical protein